MVLPNSSGCQCGFDAHTGTKIINNLNFKNMKNFENKLLRVYVSESNGKELGVLEGRVQKVETFHTTPFRKDWRYFRLDSKDFTIELDNTEAEKLSSQGFVIRHNVSQFNFTQRIEIA